MYYPPVSTRVCCRVYVYKRWTRLVVLITQLQLITARGGLRTPMVPDARDLFSILNVGVWYSLYYKLLYVPIVITLTYNDF